MGLTLGVVSIALLPGSKFVVTQDVLMKKGKVNAKNWRGVVLENLDAVDEENWGACCELAWDQPNLKVSLSPPHGYLAQTAVLQVHQLRREGEENRRGKEELVEGERVIVIEGEHEGRSGLLLASKPSSHLLQVRLDDLNLVGYLHEDEVQIIQ